MASTLSGSSGSPIVLKDTNLVIGIHKNENKNLKENYGDFIGPIFLYFKYLYKLQMNAALKPSLKDNSKQKILFRR